MLFVHFHDFGKSNGFLLYKQTLYVAGNELYVMKCFSKGKNDAGDELRVMSLSLRGFCSGNKSNSGQLTSMPIMTMQLSHKDTATRRCTKRFHATARDFSIHPKDGCFRWATKVQRLEDAQSLFTQRHKISPFAGRSVVSVEPQRHSNTKMHKAFSRNGAEFFHSPEGRLFQVCRNRPCKLPYLHIIDDI